MKWVWARRCKCCLSSRQSKSKKEGPTLILCPVSVLYNWETQAKQHVSSFSVYLFHGTDRERKKANLEKFDLVIASYATLLADSNKGQKKNGLMSVNWARVVCDEAHVIRNSSSKTFEAVCELQRCYTWCVTGTPVVNSVDDLFANLKLIQCEPLNDKTWWKKLIQTPIMKETDVHLLLLLFFLCLCFFF
jgi:SNF2 family DNA or RNA helicase